MATECPRTVTTHREIALPPEIVALVLSFKPVDSGHIGKIVRSGHSITPPHWDIRTVGGWPYYDCCGKNDSYYPAPCRWIDDEGRYHPGTLEAGSYEYNENPSGSFTRSHGGYVRWTCCGARFGQRFSHPPRQYRESPRGCTRLDLTLRVTTVTRTQTDPEQGAWLLADTQTPRNY